VRCGGDRPLEFAALPIGSAFGCHHRRFNPLWLALSPEKLRWSRATCRNDDDSVTGRLACDRCPRTRAPQRRPFFSRPVQQLAADIFLHQKLGVDGREVARPA